MDAQRPYTTPLYATTGDRSHKSSKAGLAIICQLSVQFGRSAFTAVPDQIRSS